MMLFLSYLSKALLERKVLRTILTKEEQDLPKISNYLQRTANRFWNTWGRSEIPCVFRQRPGIMPIIVMQNR